MIFVCIVYTFQNLVVNYAITRYLSSYTGLPERDVTNKVLDRKPDPVFAFYEFLLQRWQLGKVLPPLPGKTDTVTRKSVVCQSVKNSDSGTEDIPSYKVLLNILAMKAKGKVCRGKKQTTPIVIHHSCYKLANPLLVSNLSLLLTSCHVCSYLYFSFI